MVRPWDACLLLVYTPNTVCGIPIQFCIINIQICIIIMQTGGSLAVIDLQCVQCVIASFVNKAIYLLYTTVVRNGW